VLNPLVAVLILIAGIVICFARRDKALIAFLAASILIPMDQVLLIGSLHFPMLRILILFGMLRLLTRRTHSPKNFLSGGINKIDVAVIVSDLDRAKELKPNQQTELRGQYETFYKDQNSISISQGWLMAGK